MLSADVEWWCLGRCWISLPASLELLDRWFGDTDLKPESPEFASFLVLELWLVDVEEHESELDDRLSDSTVKCKSSFDRLANFLLITRKRRIPLISLEGDGVGVMLRLPGTTVISIRGFSLVDITLFIDTPAPICYVRSKR